MVSVPPPREIFRLNGIHPWGSIGNILIHGFFWDVHERDKYELVRSGPVAPPISFPCECVVTETVKSEIENSGLAGFHFEPVPLGKVVASDWHEWDLAADFDYSKLPQNVNIGEPEDVIFKARHRPKLAAQMPKFWRLTGTRCHFAWKTVTPRELYWTRSKLNGGDFWTPETDPFGWNAFVSLRAKEWFDARYGKWLNIDVVKIVE